ncbi:MAG: porin [Phaeodactylibacter sp.]|nr:porin [Phaeodactylibacter sp.]MCB9301073.1 porin [Lewinellaceae bacterium]
MNEKRLLRLLPLFAFLLGLAWAAPAQEAQKPEVDHSYKPLTLKLSEDGNKYVRFIIWHQQWVQTNNLAVEDSKLQLTSLVRRSRFLAYAQISPRFLILTHFGLNGLTPDNLTSLGNNGDSPQLFLHDAWTEFKVSNDNALFIGGGLHYWKGFNRLSSQSTLNFMTLDQSRPFVSWHSLAITDQFARHLGLYAKGELGKFDYRLAVNNPGHNGLQADRGVKNSGLTYDGFIKPDKNGDPMGNTIIEGYFRYNFFDKESTKLPYNVGSYLGSKKVFAVGAGFFAHPNGMFNNATGDHESVTHFSVDAFLDMPLAGNDCLNAYAAFMNFNYGENYVSRWAGTGTVIYGQVGYKFPNSRFMPYVAIQAANYDGFNDSSSSLDVGLNYFISGHNAKLTLEYHSINGDLREGGLDANGDPQDIQQIRLQAHIFL